MSKKIKVKVKVKAAPHKPLINRKLIETALSEGRLECDIAGLEVVRALDLCNDFLAEERDMFRRALHELLIDSLDGNAPLDLSNASGKKILVERIAWLFGAS